MFVKSFTVVLICFLTLFNLGQLDHVYKKIYQKVDSSKLAFCNKFLNETSIIGCEGPASPSTGILLPNFTLKAVDYIEKYNSSYHKFIPILSASDINLKIILLKLKKLNDKIAGILVINHQSQDFAPLDNIVRSDDVSCPNSNPFSISNKNQTIGDNKCSRNWIDPKSAEQIGSFFEHWPFQIFYIEDDETIRNITNCTSKWNRDLFSIDHKNNNSIKFRGDNLSLHPFCSAELYNPTYAPNDALNLKQCSKRTDRVMTLKPTFYCDQITMQNILVPIVPMFNSTEHDKQSIIIIAVRMDSLSLYSGKSPAADSVFTALITSISIAQTMTKYYDNILATSLKHPIIFAFYGGESMNFIGSSYHAFELNKNQLKLMNKTKFVNDNGNDNDESSYSQQWVWSGMDQIQLNQIGFVLELNQLASHPHNTKQSTFWIYSQTSHTKNNSLGEEIINTMINNNALSPELDLKFADPRQPFPPSSVNSFLSYNNGSNDDDIDIEAAVITNHNGPFTNRYYHSVFDTVLNIVDDDDFNRIKFHLNTKQSHRKYDTSHLSIHLSRLVNAISQTLAQVNYDNSSDILTDFEIPSPPPQPMADLELIDQMINCIFIDNNCSLFYQIRPQNPGFYNKTNFQNTDLTSEVIFELVYDLMRTVTGQNVLCPKSDGNFTENEPNIDQAFYYYYQSQLDSNDIGNQTNSNGTTLNNEQLNNETTTTTDKQCHRHQVFRRETISPYFLENVDQLIRNRTSQWVVSHKHKSNLAPRLRIFLVTTILYDYTMFVVGLIVLVGSIIIISLFKL